MVSVLQYLVYVRCPLFDPGCGPSPWMDAKKLTTNSSHMNAKNALTYLFPAYIAVTRKIKRRDVAEMAIVIRMYTPNRDREHLPIGAAKIIGINATQKNDVTEMKIYCYI